MEQGYAPHSRETNPDIEDWRELRACTEEDNKLFFSERAADIKAAKAICSHCVVQEDCLEYALQENQYIGLWGGMDEEERRIFRRRWLSIHRRNSHVS